MKAIKLNNQNDVMVFLNDAIGFGRLDSDGLELFDFENETAQTVLLDAVKRGEPIKMVMSFQKFEYNKKEIMIMKTKNQGWIKINKGNGEETKITREQAFRSCRRYYESVHVEAVLDGGSFQTISYIYRAEGA